MNTNHHLSDEHFKNLFKEIPVETPSAGFNEKVMLQIEKKAIRQKQVKQWNLAGLVSLGVLGISGIPMLIFYFLGFEIPNITLKFSNFSTWIHPMFRHIQIDHRIIILGLVILLLLISDSLFRKLALHRKESQETISYEP